MRNHDYTVPDLIFHAADTQQLVRGGCKPYKLYIDQQSQDKESEINPIISRAR